MMLIEPIGISDVFVSGLGEVEDLGDGCYRFTFYTRHHTDFGEQRVIVAKLIAHRSAVPPAILMAAKAVGCSSTGAMLAQMGLH